MSRQLVTIRTVKELRPIEGADRIELAVVDGWQCVVKKGDFQVGDPGLYFEIDSMVPTSDMRFTFLAKGKVQPFARIKTIRLKGVLSQGLLLPLHSNLRDEEFERYRHNEQLADILKVEKYEPPLPIGGQQKGTFPTHLVPKTDQERIQNIPEVLNGTSFWDYEVTEKLDGTSCTIWYHDSHVGVASRNWEMDRDDDNVYAKILKDTDLVAKLTKLGRNIAIQGEIIGPGIQGNKYQLGSQTFYVFDIYDIDAKRYFGSTERVELTQELGLHHVPVLNFFWTFYQAPSAQPVNQGDENTLLNLDLVLEAANGESRLAKVAREGIVFKALGGGISFKAISNDWLLENE